MAWKLHVKVYPQKSYTKQGLGEFYTNLYNSREDIFTTLQYAGKQKMHQGLIVKNVFEIIKKWRYLFCCVELYYKLQENILQVLIL